MSLSPLILIMIGMAAMMVLATGIIMFVVMYQRRVINHQLEIKNINEEKQQELIRATIQSEEEERQRIASELHDDIGASLASVRLFFHRAVKTGDPEIAQQSKELLDDTIQSVRTISHSLQPAVLQQLGLQMALQSYTEMITRSGIKMDYTVFHKIPKLEDRAALAIYRIVQELVNNLIKHAFATEIKLEVNPLAEHLLVILSHNGSGMTQEQFQEQIYKKGAIGLKNIVNRLASVKGSILFAKKEHLYIVEITVPFVYSPQTNQK